MTYTSKKHCRRVILCCVVLTIAFLGCSKDNKNPFLATPGAGVTGATLNMRALDYTEPPYVKAIFQVVSNSGGRLQNFQLGNFSILEDGKPVIPFEVGTIVPPFYAALVIDRSGSMGTTLTTAANAGAVDFVNALGVDDYCAVIDFESDVKTTVDFTTDKTTLINAINAGEALGGTAFYDGIIQAARLLAQKPGLKLMIALTDGDDTASSSDYTDTISEISNTGIIVYTVALGNGISDTNLSIMQQIAQAVGGTRYDSADGTDLGAIFTGILSSSDFIDLVYVKFRRRSSGGDITVFMNYGDIRAKAFIKDARG